MSQFVHLVGTLTTQFADVLAIEKFVKVGNFWMKVIASANV
jgi:hypothetical protein